MKFNKLDNNPNFPSMQEDMLKFWEEDKTFLKSLEVSPNNSSYFSCDNVLYEKATLDESAVALYENLTKQK